MKGRLLIIALLLSASFTGLSGQFPAAMGAKGGLALANQSYKLSAIDHKLETQAIGGAVFTLFAEAFRGPRLSFQFDLGYAGKGSSTTTHSVTVDHLEGDRIRINEGDPVRSRFHYLTLLPQARYRFGLSGLTPYLLLGPRVDFLLDYSSESEYPLESQNHTVLGLSLGAGLEYPLQKTGLFAEVQYQPDLSPVSDQDALLINNNILSLTLGIRWISSE